MPNSNSILIELRGRYHADVECYDMHTAKWLVEAAKGVAATARGVSHASARRYQLGRVTMIKRYNAACILQNWQISQSSVSNTLQLTLP